jgi:LacI family transcriptional regulator
MIARGLEMGSLSSVKVDNRAGGFAALNHLYSEGHRRIAFIRGPEALSDSAVRWSGVLDFARSRNLTINPSLVVDLPESRASLCAFEDALMLTRGLLRKRESASQRTRRNDRPDRKKTEMHWPRQRSNNDGSV